MITDTTRSNPVLTGAATAPGARCDTPNSTNVDPHLADEGQWNPDVQHRLDGFMGRVERGEVDHPTAVFDFDGTLSRQDLGENFLKWQITNRKLKDVDYSQDIYRQYEDELKRDYRSGSAMCVSLMKGLEDKDVRAWAADFAKSHVEKNAFAGQRELVDRMLKAGVDVWIVSASAQYLVEAAAPHLGIAADHAVGVQAEVRDGVLTGNVPGIIPYREGKVAAIDLAVGRTPDFVAGNTWSDYEMVGSAKSVSLLINPADEPPHSLLRQAEANGWGIQDWPGEH
jgi:HAD superfamily hydrolase (TIGR01490 family)